MDNAWHSTSMPSTSSQPQQPGSAHAPHEAAVVDATSCRRFSTTSSHRNLAHWRSVPAAAKLVTKREHNKPLILRIIIFNILNSLIHLRILFNINIFNS